LDYNICTLESFITALYKVEIDRYQTQSSAVKATTLRTLTFQFNSSLLRCFRRLSGFMA